MKTSVYDLPTRILHWSFAILFFISFSIAKTIDDESSLYVYHMLSGIIMSFIVVLRIILGFFGSKSARFSSYNLSVPKLIEYLKGVSTQEKSQYDIHNPASSFATMGMYLLSFCMVGSGILMSNGGGHFFEEVHEVLGTIFLVLVLAHVGGVVLHYVKFDEGILSSMVTGKKEVQSFEGLKSQSNFVGVLFLVLILGFSSYVNSSYDPNSSSITMLGQNFRLGEDEHGEKGEYSKKENHHEEHDEYDDDDDD